MLIVKIQTKILLGAGIYQFIFLSVFDECLHYEELDDESRAASVQRGNTLKCDQKDLVTPKWYRFTGAAGTMMPTSCVPKHYCGTHAPGWLSGSHPTSIGQTVNGKVCFHWGGNCCHWHANVQIKRCNGFYVYKLERTPVCWLRYCGNAGHGIFELDSIFFLFSIILALLYLYQTFANSRSRFWKLQKCDWVNKRLHMVFQYIWYL